MRNKHGRGYNCGCRQMWDDFYGSWECGLEERENKYKGFFFSTKEYIK